MFFHLINCKKCQLSRKMKISEIVQRLVAGAAEYPLPGTLILLETGKTLHLRLLNDFWFVFTIDTMGGYFSRKVSSFQKY